MHNDLETLRSTIIPTELDCHQAELDGTIKISTPEYGSIEALDIKLQLRGGKGTAMFQPIGFSRPDSWCKGTAFYPPKNDDEAIEYLDFSSQYERKKLWPTSKIRRAVVTYRLETTVQRSIGYLSDDGEKLIIPNKLEITRQRNRLMEKIIDQKHYQSVGGTRNSNELESYSDIEHVRLLPIQITTCVVQFCVNVGWCHRVLHA